MSTVTSLFATSPMSRATDCMGSLSPISNPGAELF